VNEADAGQRPNAGRSEGGSSPTSDQSEAVALEPRWPMAVALSCFIVLSIVLRVVEPDHPGVGPHWLVPGLLYWELDSGGPLARYERRRTYPDFAFSQHLNPELAPPGWRPRYVDYLILGLTTNTAFSPTDVMPMAAWAKLTMALQSLISLSVIGLVIARAVNVCT
jgi:hypothetical protein